MAEEPGTVEILVEDLPDRSEGIAFDGPGRLFISLPGEVLQLQTDGRSSVFAGFESALGLTVSETRRLVRRISLVARTR